MKVLIIYLIIYHLSAIKIEPNEIMISIDNNPKNKISSYTLTIVNQTHINNNLKIGKVNITNIKSQSAPVTQNKSFRLKLQYDNGEISSDIATMKYILRKDNKIAISYYEMNYTYWDYNRIITSSLLTNLTNAKERIAEELISCLYSIDDLKYNISSLSKGVFAFDKIIHFSSLTFGFSKETHLIYMIYYDNDGNYHSEALNSEMLQNINMIDDVWLIDQAFYQKSLLVVLDSSKMLYFYTIDLIDQYDFQLNLYETIDLGNIYPLQLPIIKIGVMVNPKTNDNYFIYINNDKVNAFEKTNNSWKVKTLIQNVNDKKITDFIINKSTVYVFIPKVGIEIYLITATNTLTHHKTLSHFHIKHINYYINPFYGYYFIGMQLSPSSSSRDLFLEFFVQDDLNPLINKIFLSNSARSFQPFHSVDAFFLYLYDEANKEIIMIRKGLLNSVPYLTFKFTLPSSTQLNDVKLSSIVNHDSGLHFPALISGNNLHIIENIELPNHYVDCVFPSDGNYSIIMMQKGEICAGSMQEISPSNPSEIQVCQKVTEYLFEVIEYDHFGLDWTVYICLILILLNILGTFTAVLWKKQCCKTSKRRIRGVSFMKNNQNKQTLYKEDKENDSFEKRSEVGTPSSHLSSNKNLKVVDVVSSTQSSKEMIPIPLTSNNTVESEHNHKSVEHEMPDDLFESPTREALTKKHFRKYYTHDFIKEIPSKEKDEENI